MHVIKMQASIPFEVVARAPPSPSASSADLAGGTSTLPRWPCAWPRQRARPRRGGCAPRRGTRRSACPRRARPSRKRSVCMFPPPCPRRRFFAVTAPASAASAFALSGRSVGLCERERPARQTFCAVAPHSSLFSFKSMQCGYLETFEPTLSLAWAVAEGSEEGAFTWSGLEMPISN